MLLIFIFFSALANEDENGKPFINPELSPNVTGVLGKEIQLACHIEDLGNETVSLRIKNTKKKCFEVFEQNLRIIAKILKV